MGGYINDKFLAVSQIFKVCVCDINEQLISGFPVLSFCLCLSARYYSVMWCKASSRKHKRWEGDAVLVATGRSVVLKDMEGRDIGRSKHTTAHI